MSKILRSISSFHFCPSKTADWLLKAHNFKQFYQRTFFTSFTMNPGIGSSIFLRTRPLIFCSLCALHLWRSAKNPSERLGSRKSKIHKQFIILYLLLGLCLVFKALELLPSSIEVREVYTFLLNVLEDKEKKRKNCQVLKSLLFAEHLQVGTIQTNLCSPPRKANGF